MDIVLFYQDGRYISSHYVVKQLGGNYRLAKELWGLDNEGQTWDLIYVLGKGRPEDIAIGDVAKIAGEGPRTAVRGLWVLDRAASARVIEHFGLAR